MEAATHRIFESQAREFHGRILRLAPQPRHRWVGTGTVPTGFRKVRPHLTKRSKFGTARNAHDFGPLAHARPRTTDGVEHARSDTSRRMKRQTFLALLALVFLLATVSARAAQEPEKGGCGPALFTAGLLAGKVAATAAFISVGGPSNGAALLGLGAIVTMAAGAVISAAENAAKEAPAAARPAPPPPARVAPPPTVTGLVVLEKVPVETEVFLDGQPLVPGPGGSRWIELKAREGYVVWRTLTARCADGTHLVSTITLLGGEKVQVAYRDFERTVAFRNRGQVIARETFALTGADLAAVSVGDTVARPAYSRRQFLSGVVRRAPVALAVGAAAGIAVERGFDALGAGTQSELEQWSQRRRERIVKDATERRRQLPALVVADLLRQGNGWDELGFTPDEIARHRKASSDWDLSQKIVAEANARRRRPVTEEELAMALEANRDWVSRLVESKREPDAWSARQAGGNEYVQAERRGETLFTIAELAEAHRSLPPPRNRTWNRVVGTIVGLVAAIGGEQVHRGILAPTAPDAGYSRWSDAAFGDAFRTSPEYAAMAAALQQPEPGKRIVYTALGGRRRLRVELLFDENGKPQSSVTFDE